MTYSALRANLKKALDQVTSDREPLTVERKSGEPVVMLAESDYRSLEETAYLLRSPANARRLLNALHGSRAKDKTFASIDELIAKLGLRP